MSNEFRSWEDLTDLEQAHVIWCDLHKDAYGFRPRGLDVSHWTLKDFETEFAILQEAIARSERERRLCEQQAIVHFERRLQELGKLGASSRDDAIRWCLMSDEAQDLEQLAWLNDLPYDYFVSKN